MECDNGRKTVQLIALDSRRGETVTVMAGLIRGELGNRARKEGLESQVETKSLEQTRADRIPEYPSISLDSAICWAGRSGRAN